MSMSMSRREKNDIGEMSVNSRGLTNSNPKMGHMYLISGGVKRPHSHWLCESLWLSITITPEALAKNKNVHSYGIMMMNKRRSHSRSKTPRATQCLQGWLSEANEAIKQ